MRRTLLQLLFITIAFAIGTNAIAQCVSSRTNVLTTYASIQIVPHNFPAGSNAVQNAMGQMEQ